MRLTRSLLYSAGTSECGYNRHQLKLLGVGWPPKHGWLNRLIGTEISDRDWNTVLALKHTRRKDRNRIIEEAQAKQSYLTELICQFDALP